MAGMLPLALLGASSLVLLSAPLASQNEVKWYQGTFDEALQLAGDRSIKLLFVYVWNDSTDAAFYTQTLQAKPVVKALGDYVCFSADGANDAGRAVFARYGLKKGPVVLMVRPDGEVEDALSGFYSGDDLLAELTRIRAGKDTLGVMRKAAAANPKDLELQFKLATKLRACGDAEGYQETLAAIKAADPKAKTETGALVQFNEIVDATFSTAITPANVKLKPLKDFLVKQKNKRVLFLGYDRIAAAEQRRDNLKAAVAAARRAWKVCPDDEAMDWGNRGRGRGVEAAQGAVQERAQAGAADRQARGQDGRGGRPELDSGLPAVPGLAAVHPRRRLLHEQQAQGGDRHHGTGGEAGTGKGPPGRARGVQGRAHRQVSQYRGEVR